MGDYSYSKVILAIELVKRLDPSESLSATTVLVLLYIMQYPGRSVSEYGKLSDTTRTAISRHILVLTERGDRARGRPGLGLVEARESTADARIKLINLTDKGRRLAQDIGKVLS